MPKDDVFVNKVFNLILFSDVSKITGAEMRRYIGVGYAKYETLRAQLVTHILKVHAEGDPDEKPEGVVGNENQRVPDGLQFMDCDVHSGSHEILKIEAAGEKDWHQHSMWACFFSSLSGAFEEARDTLREVYNEIYAWPHKDDCGMMTQFRDPEGTDVCTCGIDKLQDKMLATLKKIGAA